MSSVIEISQKTQLHDLFRVVWVFHYIESNLLQNLLLHFMREMFYPTDADIISIVYMHDVFKHPVIISHEGVYLRM